MTRGAYILVVGPSGSGKNTLITAAREALPTLAIAISATTRTPREGEVDGVNYHFLTREIFMEKVEKGAFLEWAEYGGNLYGTLRSEVEPKIAEGKYILSDIELQGVHQIMANLPKEERITIYIDGGTWEELVPRIQARAALSDVDLEKRHARYQEEIAFKPDADYVVSNKDGELEQSKDHFIQILKGIVEA